MDRRWQADPLVGQPTDPQNNVSINWKFGGTSISCRDSKAGGEVTIWQTPVSGSRSRHGGVEKPNRLWFAEYGGTSTDVIKQWTLPDAKERAVRR